MEVRKRGRMRERKGNKIKTDGEKGETRRFSKKAYPEELSKAFQAIYILHFTGFQE